MAGEMGAKAETMFGKRRSCVMLTMLFGTITLM